MGKKIRNGGRYELYQNRDDKQPTFIRTSFYDLRYEIEDAIASMKDFIVKDTITGKVLGRDEAMRALENAAKKS